MIFKRSRLKIMLRRLKRLLMEQIKQKKKLKRQKLKLPMPRKLQWMLRKRLKTMQKMPKRKLKLLKKQHLPLDPELH